MTFEGLNLRAPILKAINGCGYKTPTPIQQRAIPPALEGRDVMGLAQTGTGKTAAFLLPIMERLTRGPRGRVRALIVAPTRELAGQIHADFMKLGRHTGLKGVEIYGGVGMTPQLNRLRQGVDVVVACPGRLLDHITRGTVNLSRLEMLVLDEADRMFDMGFLPDVRKIMSHVPSTRQTMLFSATMPPEIRRLADDVLTDPQVVQVDAAAPASTVSHALYPVGQHLKTALLVEILGRTEDTGSVLVFTRTKHRAKRLAGQLERAGHRAVSLQGDMAQNKRQAALDGFRDGRYRILVATDIAARGIDVPGISHVINYDIPDTADAYTHRVGRTGRAARTGDAFTLVAPEDAAMVRAIERVMGAKIRTHTLPGFDYAVPTPERDAKPARPPRPTRPSGAAKPRPSAEAGARKGAPKRASGWTPGSGRRPAHPVHH